MHKFLTFSVFILSALFLTSAEVVRGPYVEDITQNTAIVKWRTDNPSVGWLEYGPHPHCSQIMALSTNSMEHQVIIHGLVPNKDFCYKLYVQNEAEDGTQLPVEGKFKTLYTPERKVVKFVVLGNTSDGSDADRALLAEKAAIHNPDFYIHTGNLVSTGLNEDADKEFFTPFKNLFLKAPMFIAVGEREYGPEPEKKENAGVFTKNYKRLHTMSWGKGTPQYYFFDTANARFIFLDTSSAIGAAAAPSMENKSAMVEWLRTTLARAGTDKWKIVVMHHPAYATNETGSYTAVRDSLSHIFEYYGTHLVIQGHENAYERIFPVKGGVQSERGVPYITFGTGAVPAFSKRKFNEDWTARYVSNQVYGVGEIVDRRMTIKVYNTEDKLVDTLELEFNDFK